MLILTAIFLSSVVVCARNVAMDSVSSFGEELKSNQKSYNELIKNRADILKEKKELEAETLETFTLYEMTKEITKSFDEDNAFGIFKQKLLQHIVCQDLKIVMIGSKEANEMKASEDYFVYTLKAKRKNIGLLAIKGLQKSDKEKFLILANQFALSLRRIRLYQEIERIAITDGLTNVHTRRYTLDRFEEEFQRSKLKKISLSFLMIDVDHFKKFNDTYGHLTGDQILREIAGIIEDSVREIDIAGRFGGEEFCVVLPDTDQSGAEFAAERIRVAAEAKVIKAYDATVNATLSIGIATYPLHGDSVEDLLEKADSALYQAKKDGRNRVCTFKA